MPNQPFERPFNEADWPAQSSVPGSNRAGSNLDPNLNPDLDLESDLDEDLDRDRARPGQRRDRPGFWLVGLLGRLAFLGAVATASGVAGIAIATAVPGVAPPWLVGPIDQPPIELGFENLERWLKRWGQPTSQATPLVAIDHLPEPVPDLPPERRQALQTELKAIQGQVAQVLGQVGAIEASLGRPRPNDPLERRLQAIAIQLDTDRARVSRPTQTNGRSLITLPSDSLFTANDSVLRPEAPAILDSILAELQAYPRSTIRITAHTDRLGDVTDNLELSIRRSRSVMDYLAQRLNRASSGSNYRWLVIGAGEGQPVVPGDDDLSYRRNRRIEIAIDPQG